MLNIPVVHLLFVASNFICNVTSYLDILSMGLILSTTLSLYKTIDGIRRIPMLSMIVRSCETNNNAGIIISIY